MGRNVLETVLGMGVIVIAIGFLVFGVRYVDTDATKDTYTAYAYFNNVGGLKAGADIRISGVLVGRVEHVRINMDEFKAEVKNASVEIDCVAHGYFGFCCRFQFVGGEIYYFYHGDIG